MKDASGLALGKAFVGFVKYFAGTDLHNHVFTPGQENPVRISPQAVYSTRPLHPHFVLEDPLDSTNDITRGTYQLAHVQQLMWYSLHALSQFPAYGYGRIPSILSSVINPRDFAFLSRLDKTETDKEEGEKSDDRGQ